MTVSTQSRPQPPSINDPREGDILEEGSGTFIYGSEDDDDGLMAEQDGSESGRDINWMSRARQAFAFSTSFVDSNYRKSWEDSIRAFNSQHPGESKYNSDLFRKRSSIFRPKTRAIIRKNEAAAAAAFFSNIDRITVGAVNEAVPQERLSAAIMKELLQYRLTVSIPWFQTVLGAFQDAQVQGVCAAHVHWRFTTKRTKGGDLEKVEDMPVVDLIPIENLRIDGAAHWLDPINTSPYLIHLIPMYVVDVKARMNKPDPKGRTWKHYDDATFASFKAGMDDSTRKARIKGSEDATQQRRSISDYDVIWIHRHIHRHAGQDWEFYTLASEKLLTEPEPLADTVFHGKRPYVMGNTILETHRPFPTSIPEMTKGLQEEANEIANQRLDNVKFVLNKRWFAKRGKNVDLASLVRNVPGGITLLDDPETDVKEVTWPDVTQSSYLEQDRIDSDFSDLAGNFDPMQVSGMKVGQASTATMRMLQGPSNLLTEYMLKTFTETFVQPVLRHLILLEQHYETDEVVLGVAGQKAKAMMKFGVSEIQDSMLDHELTCTVNVGMGATDPVAKLQRFIYGIQSFAAIAARPPAGINLEEIAKEIFGLSGYQDGDRFFNGQDPDKVHAQQVITAMAQKLKEVTSKVREKEQTQVVKLQVARESNATKLLATAMQHDNGNRQLLAQHLMELEKTQVAPTMAAQQQQPGQPPQGMPVARPAPPPGMGAGAPAAGGGTPMPAPPPGQGGGL